MSYRLADQFILAENKLPEIEKNPVIEGVYR